VPEQFLHGADIRAGFEQVGGEAVPQRVAADGLRNVCPARRAPDGSLQGRLVQVVSPYFPRGRIDAKTRGREDLLPGPLSGRAGVLAFEGGPEGRTGVSKLQVPGMERSDVGKMGGEPLETPRGRRMEPR
jgi:hypothetical protein